MSTTFWRNESNFKQTWQEIKTAIAPPVPWRPHTVISPLIVLIKMDKTCNQSRPGSSRGHSVQQLDHRGTSAGGMGVRIRSWWRMKRNAKQSNGDQLCWSCFLISVWALLNIYDSKKAPPQIQTSKICKHIHRQQKHTYADNLIFSYMCSIAVHQSTLNHNCGPENGDF